jgi:hypothetical protein
MIASSTTRKKKKQQVVVFVLSSKVGDIQNINKFCEVI